MRAAEQAQAIAKRLGKPTLRIALEDNGVRLDPVHWAGFWTSFVHLIRNAIDHGIELPEQREQVGKAPEGSLTLRTELTADAFYVVLSDDGRGIDWAAIADKAHKLGLPYQTHEALVEALFADGLTTRSEVSEYSGRGVGMGVLREACRSRGGELRVESRSGQGTTVEFRFPRSAVEASIQLRRAS
jgi:chemotaxis protein histidine kinase CheA